MEKVLRTETLDVNPNTVDAPGAWRHWLATFENFIESLQRPNENLDKLRILIHFVAPEIYELFYDSNNYDEGIAKLKTAYVKTLNKIFARHTFLSPKQRPEESLDEYLRVLTVLSKNCDFKLFIRDAFSSGLPSNQIC